VGSSEVWGCCGLDDSSLMAVASLFTLSEGKCGLIVVLVPVGDDRVTASGSEETEVNGALTTGPDVMSLWVVPWEEGGAGPSCSSATAAARFVGHNDFFTWRGE
jgi:hypothetical protein